MFTFLLGGTYAAYKHFSGLDPLKLDPQAILKNVLASRSPQQFVAALSSLKLNTSFPNEDKKLAAQSFKNNTPTGLENLTQPQTVSSNYLFKFMLVADSHNDNDNLRKAISQVKKDFPDTKFIIGLGDYTDAGTEEELKKAKNEFDLSTLRYFLIAGDHDLWDSRNRNIEADTNFKAVFGPAFQSFTFDNFKFLLLDNSDNYQGISSEQQKWISDQLEKSKTENNQGVLVFIHEPLYHPSSDHFMGRVEKELKQQAESLIFQLKTAGVKKIFSGDTHYFSEYEEPVTKLPMVTVGAVVTDRNPQAPRFAIVYVYQDGTTKVEDLEIK